MGNQQDLRLEPAGGGFEIDDRSNSFIIFNSELELWRIDPHARDATSSVGEAVIYDPGFEWGTEGFHMPPWHELIIYEMHIGNFNDQPGGLPGNLDAAIEKLPRLEDTGINAIQVMPPMEFAGGFGNHFGYDTTAGPGAKDGMPYSGNIGIGPYSVIVLSLDY